MAPARPHQAKPQHACTPVRAHLPLSTAPAVICCSHLVVWQQQSPACCLMRGVLVSGESSSGGQTGAWVDLGFFPLSFFLFFCTPRVEVDGVVHQLPWGRHFIPMAPGVHRIRVWFPYMGVQQCGLNGIDLSLSAGQSCMVKYFMPPWMFSAGSINLVGQPGRAV